MTENKLRAQLVINAPPMPGWFMADFGPNEPLDVRERARLSQWPWTYADIVMGESSFGKPVAEPEPVAKADDMTEVLP